MTDTHWAIITGYRIVIAIFGCWLAARLAPSQPMNHALITGGIGMCIATAGAIYAWDKGPAIRTALVCDGTRDHRSALRVDRWKDKWGHSPFPGKRGRT